MNRNSFLVFTLSLTAGATGALADTPPTRTKAPVVAFIDAAKPACWARSYTADHMTSHPKQKVSSIALSYVPELKSEGEMHKQWDQYSEVPTIYVRIAARLNNDSRQLLGGGGCTAAGAKVLNCFMDGDAGSYTLTLQDDGAVLLENPTSFAVDVVPAVATDGPAEDGIMIEAKDDHKSFLMPKAKGGLCDVKWPDLPG